MSAHTILTLAVEAALERGTRIPCRDRPEWLSDDPEERAEAADACRPCPVIELCAEAAHSKPRQQFGVWAAKDYTRTPRKERSDD